MEYFVNGICGSITLLFNYIFAIMLIAFRRPKKVAYAILGASWLLSAIASMVLYTSGFVVKYNAFLSVILAFFYILFGVAVMITAKGGFAKKLFVVLMTMDFFVLVISFGYFLSKKIFGDMSSIVTEIVIRGIVYVITYIILYKLLRPVFTSEEYYYGKAWMIFDIVTILYFACLVYINNRFRIIGTNYSTEQVLILILGLVMTASFIGMLYAFREINRYNRERNELLRMRSKDALLSAELDAQEELIYNAKKFRHDIKHHVGVVCSYLDEKKYDEASGYLREYSNNVDSTSTDEYSKNHIVNAVFRLYTAKCKKAGISHSFFTDVPEKLKMNDTELCGLISNMLENAVESCEKCDKPSISFRLTYNDGRLSAYLDNTTSATADIIDGMPISTKESGGTGTKIIAETIEKYGGVYKFDTKGDMFSTRFTILNM